LAEVPEPPAASEIDRLVTLLEPLRKVVRPEVFFVDRVPEEGALLVGNHTVYGLLDLPFMMAELWKRRGIWPRGLGEHAHYRVPGWRDLLERGGMVRGTRENCAELLSRGENVLVFPGGAREVNKRKGEKYTLIWKERVGFARLAVKQGSEIVPFAGVGGEEMLDVVIDADNPLLGPIYKAVDKTLGLPLPPVVRGIGLTPIPRPQRLYFWFGDPISTSPWAGRHEDKGALREVRDEVKAAVEGGIELLLERREKD